MPVPDYHNTEEFQNRSRKLVEIRALGVEPYPHKYPKTERTAQIALDAEGKEIGHHDDAATGNSQKVFVSGRLVLFRPM